MGLRNSHKEEKLALPKSCKMPNLSHLDSLIPGLMTALMGARGELLTEKEKLYIRVFVRLTDKAMTEYKEVRRSIEAQLKEMQRSAEEMARDGRQLYFLEFDNHMENSINAVRRLFGLLEAVKREKGGGLTIDRLLRRRIEALFNDVVNVRDYVEHIDEKIQEAETTGPLMFMLTKNDEGVEIGGYWLRFADLARLLQRFHELSIQWLDEFCKVS